MKCELAAALVHRPKVLFLDEPTIGLDVSMQATVRGFVKRYNERTARRCILTSHYMEDVARSARASSSSTRASSSTTARSTSW
jgi:ABC-2 type transport system ATP-binding protein